MRETGFLRKRRKWLCNKVLVRWTPDWVEDTCDECGHVTGQHDVAEPRYHYGPHVRRDGKYFCSGCGVEFAGLEAVNCLTRDKLLPIVTKQVEQASPILAYLKRSAAGGTR